MSHVASAVIEELLNASDWDPIGGNTYICNMIVIVIIIIGGNMIMIIISTSLSPQQQNRIIADV